MCFVVLMSLIIYYSFKDVYGNCNFCSLANFSGRVILSAVIYLPIFRSKISLKKIDISCGQKLFFGNGPINIASGTLK